MNETEVDRILKRNGLILDITDKRLSEYLPEDKLVKEEIAEALNGLESIIKRQVQDTRHVLGIKIPNCNIKDMNERKMLGNSLDAILMAMEEQHCEVPLELMEFKNWLICKGNSNREYGVTLLWDIEY